MCSRAPVQNWLCTIKRWGMVAAIIIVKTYNIHHEEQFWKDIYLEVSQNDTQLKY